jgi:hypothetical protein
MLDTCPRLSMKIIFDQLQELCAENADGQFDVLPAADPCSAEEVKVLRRLFDMVDLCGCDGVVSADAFAATLARLVAANALDADAYRRLSSANVRRLFALVEPALAGAPLEQDNLPFSAFLAIMNLKPAQRAENSMAENAADLHH